MTAISEPERPRPPGWVVVNWDDGSTGHYRVGAEGKYDLMVLGRVDALVVEGAGGVGSQCNGLYNLNGSFAGKPMFKKDGGSAIIYFSGLALKSLPLQTHTCMDRSLLSSSSWPPRSPTPSNAHSCTHVMTTLL